MKHICLISKSGKRSGWLLSVLLWFTTTAAANNDDCLQRALQQASPDTSIEALRQQCAQPKITDGQHESLVLKRFERERAVANDRSVLLPHMRNYFMPITYASEPNDAPYEAEISDDRERLDSKEAQFQLSLKVPLLQGVASPQDGLYFGFTIRSFWQVYQAYISAPFRETNYEPELFWVSPVPWRIFDSEAAALMLGLSHQSNGLSQPQSRSWNRLYANLIWERNRFVFSFKPWWRIPQPSKRNPFSAGGDDNPDIEHYLGNFEFSTLFRSHDHEYGLMLRNNLRRDDNKGAVQLEWTFPLHGRLRGYAQYFHGYGESLIDYNARIERVGIGILLSDLL